MVKAVERASLESGGVSDDTSGKAPARRQGYVRPDDVRIRYGILDRPPWWECGLLGFQVRSPSLPSSGPCTTFYDRAFGYKAVCMMARCCGCTCQQQLVCAMMLFPKQQGQRLICVVYLLQHYLTMLGSTVLIPFLLVPAMVRSSTRGSCSLQLLACL